MKNISVDDLPLYSKVTDDIIVMVQPQFAPELSRPADGHYVWTYHIVIENGGKDTVTLLRRHWRLIDDQGKIVTVSGDGVVGENPVLAPGGFFSYSSSAPLATPSGMMMGSYEMLRDSGETFSVAIPPFSLDSEMPSPRSMH